MSNLTIEQKAANAIKWLGALKSGKHKQSRAGYLYTPTEDAYKKEDEGYCCWGVGCAVFELPFDIKNDTWNTDLASLIGFTHINGVIAPSYKGEFSLGELNDRTDATFEDIADYLIANPSNFKEGVGEIITNHFKEEK